MKSKNSRKQQLPLFPHTTKRQHGGATGHGKRKTARPLDRKKPIHLVLRSQKAKRTLSLKAFHNEARVEKLVRATARQYGVRIASFVNVGNHLHILFRFRSRPLVTRWLKAMPAKVAQLVTGARKGQPFGRFWEGLVYTRVVENGRDEKNVTLYLIANAFEARYGKWVRDLFLWQQKPLPSQFS